MRCQRARRLLSAYLDGEVDPRRRARLESHLAGCATCSAELARLRAQWDRLAEVEQVPEPPHELWPQVLVALDEAEGNPWHRRYRARLVQVVCVAGCVALGFAAGALLSWRRPPAGAALHDVSVAEQMMVAEAFDTAAFGLSKGKEGLLRCVPE